MAQGDMADSALTAPHETPVAENAWIAESSDLNAELADSAWAAPHEVSVADSAAAPQGRLYAVGRAKRGVNWLRWAPETFEQWQQLLRHGVVVERHQYIGDTVLVSLWRRAPLSNLDSAAIATAAATDPWTAAMGELLFADSVELLTGGGTLSRLSQEREQQQTRFAMALMIGDRSYAAACAGLLGWRDTVGVNAASANISANAASRGAGANATYLYRIYIPQTHSDTATVLVRPQVGVLLPPRVPLSANFRDHTATLQWDSRLWREHCVGYYVERAVGREPFTPCHPHPIDVLQRDRKGAEQLTYLDSVPQGRKVRYRVMGVDLFGDRFQVTDETEGETKATELVSPANLQATAAKNGVVLTWHYPQEQEKAVSRFEVFVKDSMFGAYRKVATAQATARQTTISAALLSRSSYFCVAACNHQDETAYSAVCFYQEKDSVPPLPPTALTAYADTGGGVHLSWRPSPSPDAAGYIVLKSRRLVEGYPWQVNTELITDSVYTDSIDALMWQAAYYYVAAVDHNGNISELTAPVSVLPNRPNLLSPPRFDGCTADEKKLKIRWCNSMDTYAETHALYMAVDDGEPQLLSRRKKNTESQAAIDSLFYTLPKGRTVLTRYRFTLAVESSHGDTVWAPMPYIFLQEPQLSAPRLQAWAEREKRCVAVQWQTTPYTTVAKAYLYRKAANETSYHLLRVLTSPDVEKELYIDATVSMNNTYAYRVQFETADGHYTPYGTVSVTY